MGHAGKRSKAGGWPGTLGGTHPHGELTACKSLHTPGGWLYSPYFRNRETEAHGVIHLSTESASGKATVWVQGYLVPKAFSASHMKRGWVIDISFAEPNNLPTRNDKNRRGYEGNTTERVKVG